MRGAGSIGSRYARILQEMGVDPVLAWPVRGDAGPRPELGGTTVISGLGEAVERGVGAAVVATDTSRHSADARAHLAVGMDVLVEKPLARSAEEAAGILQAALASSSAVYVSAPLRFHESLQRARALLPALGRIHHVSIECQSFLPDWRPERDFTRSYSAQPGEGGVLRDLVHEIDYALWCFGRPSEVVALLTPGDVLGIDVDSAADVMWRLPSSGMTVRLRLDYLTRSPRRRMAVFGSDGALEWDAVESTVTLADATGKVLVEHFPADLDRDVVLQRQTAAFLTAAAGVPGNVLATADEGLHALVVCDAARASDGSTVLVKG